MTQKYPAKILIVEDDYENQKFMRIFFQKKFDIEICDSAESCYQLLENNSFDLILMDISLRGKKDGLQLTRELRQTDKYKNIPIISLSAHAFQRDKENAFDAGVDMFLTKPVQNHNLLEAILKMLNSNSKPQS